MATYRPSFVDISGLSEGISRGLEIANQEKKRQDAIAEERVDEYLKNYRPDKLRDNDIALFTGAFDQYKKAALMYTRMNRAGAKPQELAYAKSMMDKSLNNLNSIYTNSATAANKMAEYSDYIKRARLAGMDIPQGVTETYNTLLSSDINSIDAKKIKSAYDFELIPKDADIKKLTYILDNVGAKASTTVEETPYTIGMLNKKPITGIERKTIQSRPMDKTIFGIRQAAMSDNALKRDVDKLYDLFKQNKDMYMTELKKIKKDITEDQVDGATIYGMQYFMPQVVDIKRDNSGANLQIQAEQMASSQAYRNAMLKIAQRRQNLAEQKDATEKRRQIDPVKHISEFEANVKNDPRYKNAMTKNNLYIPVKDVQGFSGVSKNKFSNANVEHLWYFPKLNYYELKTNEPGSQPMKLSSKEVKNILTRGTKGAENRPYAYDDTPPTIEELESVGFPIDDNTRQLLQGINFGGGQ